MRGFNHERHDILDVARECRSLGVRLDVLDSYLAQQAGVVGPGSIEIASGIHAWNPASSLRIGVRTVAMLGNPGELSVTDVEQLHATFPQGADVAIGGELAVSWTALPSGSAASQNVHTALLALRPMLHVCSTIAGRVDVTEVVEGGGIAVCGVACSGEGSVMLLDLRTLQVRGNPNPVRPHYRNIE
jgi:hypothetical protein